MAYLTGTSMAILIPDLIIIWVLMTDLGFMVLLSVSMKRPMFFKASPNRYLETQH